SSHSRIMDYAVWVGLEGRWMMFSRLSHHERRFAIVAQYADGSIKPMPLPGQRPSTLDDQDLWTFHLRDPVELELASGLAARSTERKAYARYLCQRFSSGAGAAIVSISWKYQSVDILDPAQARAAGTNLHFSSTGWNLLEQFSCG